MPCNGVNRPGDLGGPDLAETFGITQATVVFLEALVLKDPRRRQRAAQGRAIWPSAIEMDGNHGTHRQTYFFRSLLVDHL